MPKRDGAWQYATEVEVDENKKRVKCNFCPAMVGNITRFKQHLLHSSTDVTKCPSVPQPIKSALQLREEGRRARKNQRTNAAAAAHQSTDSSHGNGSLIEDALPLRVWDPRINAAAAADQCSTLAAVVLPPLSPADEPDLNVDIIAFKGLTGACTEDAVFSVYPDCIPIAYQTFEEALQAVESLRADKAIISVENSCCGSCIEIFDLMYSHNLHIVAEVKMSINPCLLAVAGVTLEALRLVLGSPQELAQANSFLTNLGVEKQALNEDSREAQFISSNLQKPAGIIASAKAAEVYDLAVLARGIQGAAKSFTRFWVLGRDPVVPRSTDELFKTSIVFTLRDGTQNLGWALMTFSQRHIKLTKVEIRPQLHSPQMAAGSSTSTSRTSSAECFDYVFFVDIENSTADDRVCNALRHLKELATFVRVLGSYPVIEVNS